MAHKVEWNKRAVDDLQSIITYYVQQGMIQAAAGFNQKVRDKIDKLANDRPCNH